MQQGFMPLFPLPIVLYPRIHIPLHIFEDRYKEMIGEAIENRSEFGIVLAGESGIAEIGCSAIVESVTQRYPDGRLDIIVVGVRRFELLGHNTEKEYLRGSVSFFNDDEVGAAPPASRTLAVEGYKDLRRFLKKHEESEPEWEDPQLSFQLAQPITDLNFRQSLLACRSESNRIHMLAEFFPRHLEQQRHIAHVRAVAPTNGHGSSPVDS